MNKKIIYLSPSSINLYLTCPLLYKNKKVDIKKDSRFLRYGSWVHKCTEEYVKSDAKKDILKIAKSNFTKYDIDLDDFLDGQKVLKRFINREYLQYKILGSEIKLQDILSNGVALRGIIDLLVERDHETLEVIDYKSGWKFYTLSMINKNMQLKVYKNLVLNQEEYKQYKNIILTIDPLRYEPLSVVHDEVDNETFLDWISEMYTKITKDNDLKPNFPNPFCKGCHITNLCEDYKNYNKFDFKLKMDVNKKLEHYYQLKNLKKVLNQDLDYYKEFFKDYAHKNNTDVVSSNKYELKIKNNYMGLIKK